MNISGSRQAPRPSGTTGRGVGCHQRRAARRRDDPRARPLRARRRTSAWRHSSSQCSSASVLATVGWWSSMAILPSCESLARTVRLRTAPSPQDKTLFQPPTNPISRCRDRLR